MLMIAIILSICFFPLLFKTFLENSDQNYCDILPFGFWLPFDFSTKKMCALTLIYQLFGYLIGGFYFSATNSACIYVIDFLTVHFVILRYNFRTIPIGCQNLINESNTKVLDELMYEEMKKTIKQLENLLRVHKNFTRMYKTQFLVQILLNLVGICPSLLLAAEEDANSQTFWVIFFIIVVVAVDIFIHCFHGNELYLASTSISDALYESEWIDASLKYKKGMLITMQRVQKPLTLQIGDFSQYDFRTFVTILRGYYSIFAMMKKMKNDK